MAQSGIDLMDLARQEAEIARDLEKFAETFIRKILLVLFAALVRMTPRDTGRAQSGWMTGVQSAPKGVPPEGAGSYGPPDPPTSEAARFRLGMILWIVNNVNYIGVLDEGSSQQAPAGMTSVAFADLDAQLAS